MSQSSDFHTEENTGCLTYCKISAGVSAHSGYLYMGFCDECGSLSAHVFNNIYIYLYINNCAYELEHHLELWLSKWRNSQRVDVNECHRFHSIYWFIFLCFTWRFFFSFEHPREINNQCFVYAFTELLLEIEKKIISVKQSRNNGSDNHSREFQQYLRQHGYFLLINKSTVLIFLCLLPDYFSCELLVWF